MLKRTRRSKKKKNVGPNVLRLKAIHAEYQRVAKIKKNYDAFYLNKIQNDYISLKHGAFFQLVTHKVDQWDFKAYLPPDLDCNVKKFIEEIFIETYRETHEEEEPSFICLWAGKGNTIFMPLFQ